MLIIPIMGKKHAIIPPKCKISTIRAVIVVCGGDGTINEVKV
jgi:hypothetical protein